jgi:hypothetical protein
VRQFKTLPYGFKNSLAAFIRALEKAFGRLWSIQQFLVTCVYGLLIHSPTFTERLNHIDLVLDKVTRAGFTVNAAKCQFFKPEIKFLGNVISDEGVMANRERF